MELQDTLELITLAQAGDRAAFGELARRFQPAVNAVALARLRDVNEAAELTQDVFVHAMLKLSQLRDPRCFVGWLRQIAVRMAINRATRRGPAKWAEPEVLANAADVGDGPLDDILRAEQREKVQAGLSQLKDSDRDTLLAFYVRGRTLKQMSRDFETPVGTIKRRLHVARNRLKKTLERNEGEARTGESRPQARRALAAV